MHGCFQYFTGRTGKKLSQDLIGNREKIWMYLQGLLPASTIGTLIIQDNYTWVNIGNTIKDILKKMELYNVPC